MNVKNLNGEIVVEVTEQDNKSDGSLSDQSGKNKEGKEVSGLVSQETIELYAKMQMFSLPLNQKLLFKTKA